MGLDIKKLKKNREELLEHLKSLCKKDGDRLQYLQVCMRAIASIHILSEEWYKNLSIEGFDRLSVQDCREIAYALVNTAKAVVDLDLDEKYKIKLVQANIDAHKDLNIEEVNPLAK